MLIYFLPFTIILLLIGAFSGVLWWTIRSNANKKQEESRPKEKD